MPRWRLISVCEFSALFYNASVWISVCTVVSLRQRVVQCCHLLSGSVHNWMWEGSYIIEGKHELIWHMFTSKHDLFFSWYISLPLWSKHVQPSLVSVSVKEHWFGMSATIILFKIVFIYLLLLSVMSSPSTASKKPGEPLIISDIKKGSMAHRYLTESFLLYYSVSLTHIFSHPYLF